MFSSFAGPPAPNILGGLRASFVTGYVRPRAHTKNLPFRMHRGKTCRASDKSFSAFLPLASSRFG